MPDMMAVWLCFSRVVVVDSKGRKGTKETRDKCGGGGGGQGEGHQRRCSKCSSQLLPKWRSTTTREGPVPKSRQSIFSPAGIIVSATGETSSSVPRDNNEQIQFLNQTHIRSTSFNRFLRRTPADSPFYSMPCGTVAPQTGSEFASSAKTNASLAVSLSAKAQSNAYGVKTYDSKAGMRNMMFTVNFQVRVIPEL